jgi:hypothetical protein
MRDSGKRSKQNQLIRAGAFVVEIQVELFIPDCDADPEPSYGPETVRFIGSVWEHGLAGNLPWLSRHGGVFRELQTLAHGLT